MSGEEEYANREFRSHFRDELRYIRQKLDKNSEDHNRAMFKMHTELAGMKENMTNELGVLKSKLNGHAIRIGSITSGIGILVAAAAAWSFSNL